MDEIIRKMLEDAVEKCVKKIVNEIREVDSMPEVFTLQEVANLIRSSPDWLRKNIDTYCIPHFKTGTDYKFRKKQLFEWMDRNIDILSKKRKGA